MPVKVNRLPPQSVLLKRFWYEARTGLLRSKSRQCFGKIIDNTESNGYVQVGIAGRWFFAHRVIWKMMTGQEPPENIDHIDFDRKNNRWNNLRAATVSQNRHHRRFSNSHGFRGVSVTRGRYQAQIRHDGIKIHIGCFDSAEAAGAAYRVKAAELFGEFATTAVVRC